MVLKIEVHVLLVKIIKHTLHNLNKTNLIYIKPTNKIICNKVKMLQEFYGFGLY